MTHKVLVSKLRACERVEKKKSTNEKVPKTLLKLEQILQKIPFKDQKAFFAHQKQKKKKKGSWLKFDV